MPEGMGAGTLHHHLSGRRYRPALPPGGRRALTIGGALLGLAAAALAVWHVPSRGAAAPLCPTVQALVTAPGAAGGPWAADLVTDRRVAEGVLRARRAVIATRYPSVVSVRIGPGWGRGWRDASGTAALVRVRDYALVATVRSAADCPPAGEALGAIDGVPIFFAY